MKILSRYVLREHVGPLTFALTALTSIMLLNFISRQFGELVGKGLPWTVITEFFLLAIPFTVALTVPMSVLVAVLYAFSRLAAENEVTALKASGVSPWRLVSPAIGAGIVWSIGLLAFNDQVLPRANHRLKTLQDDISQTKPTFMLKEQVINPVAEGKLYLKAGRIDRAKGGMKEVVIYDLGNATQRRTIYADSGTIHFAANGRDLDMDLFHGQMQEVSTDKPGELNRLFYDHDRVRVRDVGTGGFKTSEPESSSKGDREMSVCEMQQHLAAAEGGYLTAQREYDAVRTLKPGEPHPDMPPMALKPIEPHGIGWAYCKLLSGLFRVKSAHAAEVDVALLHRASRDTVPVRRDTVPAARDTALARRDTIVDPRRRGATLVFPTPTPAPARPQLPAPLPGRGRPGVVTQVPSHLTPFPPTPAHIPAHIPAPSPAPTPAASAAASAAAAAAMREAIHGGGMTGGPAVNDARLAEAKLRLDLATRSRNRYEIEIHKKFSLAAACFIFVILGAPLAVRFPRGGVGLVIGVSLVVFALYYVGLIGGESLANEGIVPPFWAMWGTNVIMTLAGIVLLLRMGRDQNTGRGGDWSDRLEKLKARFRRRPAPAAGTTTTGAPA